MSLYKTAYDTTVGRATLTTKIEHAIKTVLIQAPAVNVVKDRSLMSSEGKEPIMGYITNRSAVEMEVPAFIHPLYVEDVHRKKFLFADIRPYIKPVQGDEEFIVRNTSEFILMKARLAMNKVWLATGPQAIGSLSSLPQSCFAAWISEGISHRFMLDPADQARLAVLAHFYYQTLFYEQSEFDSDLRDQFVASAIRSAGRIPSNIALDVASKIGKLESIQDFCETVKVVLENPRLEQFNAGLLIAVLKSSWFGASAADTLAVALEHPPTWVSLIYCALSERSFRNANLTRIAERFGKGNAADYYKRSFVSLAQSVTEEHSSEHTF